MKKNNLLIKLIIGIISGVAIGLASKALDFYIVVRLLSTFSSIFGELLKFLIPLVILGLVIPGIVNLGKSAGKFLGITLIIAYISTITAGISAYYVGIQLLPMLIKLDKITEAGLINIEPYFQIAMPPIMGVMSALVLAFLLGIGMSKFKSNSLLNCIKEFQDIMKFIIETVLIPFIPLHITGILAELTTTGKMVNIVKSFGLVLALIIGLQLIFIFVQYTIAFLISKKNPITCIKNMLPAYFTAIGTQSSEATIPVTFECTKKNGVSDEISRLVIPLGATIHLAGDTITLVIAAMGVMLMNNTVPTLEIMIPYIFMIGVTMIAAPGIPGGGVVAVLGLLEKILMFGADQQALMIAIHFAQDGFGTACNVAGDGAIAMIVDNIRRNE